MSRPWRSVTAQSLHYFGRPHTGPPAGPVGGRASWRAAAHADPAAWTHVLSPAELDHLDAALDASGDAPLGAPGASALSLGPLRAHIAGWRRALTSGRGFLRIRGVPVARWGEARTGRFFWALGLALGRPGAQNGDGDLLGHVRDLREETGQRIRQYRTAEDICFHCDAADAVGLLCLQPAMVGGRSRIASSVAIFETIVAEDPELARAWFDPLWLDVRMDTGADAVRVRPGCFHAGRLRTFLHPEYFRTATEHAGIPALSPDQLRLLERVDALANDPAYHLEMDLQRGDIQLCSNHTIVHARTAFEDGEAASERRHLLRLWLTLEGTGGVGERWLRLREAAPVAASVLRRRVALRLFR
jgi:hypothetical protein